MHFNLSQRDLSYLPLLIVGISLFFIGLYADHLNIKEKKHDLQFSILNQANAIRARLEGNINNNVMLIKGLVAAFSIEPNMSKQRYIALSDPLISNHSQVRNIAAAPNLIIEYMNPIKGNEAAIGVDYRNLPDQLDSVIQARDTRNLLITGPVNLVQGGQGFIVRAPVFIKSSSKKESKFWGIISSVIDVDKFFEISGLYDNDLEIAIQTNDGQKSNHIIYGSNEIFLQDPIVVNVTLPFGHWQLAILPKNGWLLNIENPNIFRIKLFVISLFILIPILFLSSSILKHKKSKRNLQAIMDHSPAVIFIKDIKGRYVFVNNSFEKAFQVKHDQIIGKSDYDIFPKEIADNLKRNDMGVILYDKTQESEELVPQDDGLHSYNSIKFSLLDDNNDIYAVCGISTDISKRKQAEINLRESEKSNRIIIENSPFCIHELDLSGRHISINSAGLKMMGITEEKEILGVKYLDACSDQDRPRIKKLLQEVLVGNINRFEFKSTKGKYFSSSFTPILDGKKVVRVMAMTENITDRRLNEEALRRTQKLDALGKLTGGIAHDYNNMLSVVIGYSGLLKDMLSDQPVLAQYAEEIIHASNRGVKLTRKLLDFSQINKTKPQIIEVNMLLLKQQHMLEKTLTARIQLKLNLFEGLWPALLDESDLEDAIINLCINAMHAIDGNGELIFHTNNVKLGKMETSLLNLKPGDYTLLSITDTGSGMDETTKDRIFDPFFTTKGNKGTGLGLAQVYGFVNRNNGAIRVQTKIGLGTCFSLYFPRFTEKQNGIDSDVIKLEINTRGNETILIIDDEEALLNLTKEILKQQGYKVLEATNGNQALEILVTEKIDLVLSDIILPLMDGYQLARIISDKYPSIKIQLMSGFTDNKNAAVVNKEIHDNTLMKPVDSQYLLNRIRKLLDQ